MKILCYNGGAIYYPDTLDEVNWCLSKEIYPYGLKGGFIPDVLKEYVNSYTDALISGDNGTEDAPEKYQYNFSGLLDDDLYYDIYSNLLKNRFNDENSIIYNEVNAGVLDTPTVIKLAVPLFAVYNLSIINRANININALYSYYEDESNDDYTEIKELFLNQKPLPINKELSKINVRIIDTLTAMKSIILAMHNIYTNYKDILFQLNSLTDDSLSSYYEALKIAFASIEAVVPSGSAQVITSFASYKTLAKSRESILKNTNTKVVENQLFLLNEYSKKIELFLIDLEGVLEKIKIEED